jgi:hypothetical protein
MHLCLPLDAQSKEALADSTQVDCDWEKEWVQGSGVTSYFPPEAGGCMEAYSLSALFLYRTLHKLPHSAFGEASRGQ